MTYDGVITKPDLDEALKHYGVMGMKWGVRKDLRKTGSISQKTKNKIKKAVTKASYRKTGRMLNQLERMKGDEKGRIEDVFKKAGYKNSGGIKKLNKNITQLNSVTKDINKIAKKKNYEYDKITNRIRYTKKARTIAGASAAVAGYLALPEYGAAGAYGLMRVADKKYRKQTGRQNSPYFVKGTDFYRRKKKKKK